MWLKYNSKGFSQSSCHCTRTSHWFFPSYFNDVIRILCYVVSMKICVSKDRKKRIHSICCTDPFTEECSENGEQLVSAVSSHVIFTFPRVINFRVVFLAKITASYISELDLYLKSVSSESGRCLSPSAHPGPLLDRPGCSHFLLTIGDLFLRTKPGPESREWRIERGSGPGITYGNWFALSRSYYTMTYACMLGLLRLT